MSNWQAVRKSVSGSFSKKCGLDESCLEKRHWARNELIVSSAVTRLNLYLVHDKIFELSEKENSKIKNKILSTLNKAINAVEAELERNFISLDRKTDLPW